MRITQGFEVEWCTEIPVDADGETDFDNAKYSFKDFATEVEAITFAETVAHLDHYGCARVTPFHLEPYEAGKPACFREYDGQMIEVEQPTQGSR